MVVNKNKRLWEHSSKSQNRCPFRLGKSKLGAPRTVSVSVCVAVVVVPTYLRSSASSASSASSSFPYRAGSPLNPPEYLTPALFSTPAPAPSPATNPHAPMPSPNRSTFWYIFGTGFRRTDSSIASPRGLDLNCGVIDDVVNVGAVQGRGGSGSESSGLSKSPSASSS